MANLSCCLWLTPSMAQLLLSCAGRKVLISNHITSFQRTASLERLQDWLPVNVDVKARISS
jgi:hypothetical protein